jgi:hypothetical protein
MYESNGTVIVHVIRTSFEYVLELQKVYMPLSELAEQKYSTVWGVFCAQESEPRAKP